MFATIDDLTVPTPAMVQFEIDNVKERIANLQDVLEFHIQYKRFLEGGPQVDDNVMLNAIMIGVFGSKL